ncbi:hypothetical protein BGX23_010786, partial [Mortierella sp. AD031]
MQASQPPVQAMRSVLRSSRNIPTTAHPGDILHVDIHTDPDTKNQVVLWDDIRLAFVDALYVRHQSKLVPFVKGKDLVPLKPHRIAAFTDIVLDVVVSGQLAQAEIAQLPPLSPPPSRFEQIAQQATRLPMYDSLADLRPHPSTLTNPLAPRNNTAQTPHNHPSIPLVPRSHATDAFLRIRNKTLDQQAAKDIMKKIAAHVDLKTLHEKGDGSPKDFPRTLE